MYVYRIYSIHDRWTTYPSIDRTRLCSRVCPLSITTQSMAFENRMVKSGYVVLKVWNQLVQIMSWCDWSKLDDWLNRFWILIDSKIWFWFYSRNGRNVQRDDGFQNSSQSCVSCICDFKFYYVIGLLCSTYLLERYSTTSNPILDQFRPHLNQVLSNRSSRNRRDGIWSRSFEFVGHHRHWIDSRSSRLRLLVRPFVRQSSMAV